MKHAQFKEWLYLSTVEELDPNERELLDAHLVGCEECRSEQKSLLGLGAMIAGQKPLEVTDRLLSEAREDLHRALLEFRFKRSFLSDLTAAVRDFFVHEYRLAVGGGVAIALGLFIGYLVFSGPQQPAPQIAQRELPVVQQAVQSGNDAESFTQGDTRTSNVRVIDADASKGTIEFSFEAITPMHVRGNVNDAKVQKVLAHALTTEDNAGVRIRTVNAIGTRSPGQVNLDPEVKAALISALQTDKNPGVRQEALRALLQYSIDTEVKNALVFTLMHDKNSGLRIAAINGLAAATVDGHHMDEGIVAALRQRVQLDNNNYVRRQAQTVVEEVAHR